MCAAAKKISKSKQRSSDIGTRHPLPPYLTKPRSETRRRVWQAASGLGRLQRATTKSSTPKRAHPTGVVRTLNCALVSGNAIAFPPLRTSSLTPEPGSPLSMPATASRSAPKACHSNGSNVAIIIYDRRNEKFRCQAVGVVVQHTLLLFRRTT